MGNATTNTHSATDGERTSGTEDRPRPAAVVGDACPRPTEVRARPAGPGHHRDQSGRTPPPAATPSVKVFQSGQRGQRVRPATRPTLLELALYFGTG